MSGDPADCRLMNRGTAAIRSWLLRWSTLGSITFGLFSGLLIAFSAPYNSKAVGPRVGNAVGALLVFTGLAVGGTAVWKYLSARLHSRFRMRVPLSGLDFDQADTLPWWDSAVAPQAIDAIAVDPGQAWVAKHQSLVDWAFAQFMAFGTWPTIPETRRVFARRNETVDVEAAANERPRYPNELRKYPIDTFWLNLRQLQFLPQANDVVGYCLLLSRVLIRRYLSDSDELVSNEDVAFQQADQVTMMRAFFVLAAEFPSPIAGTTVLGEKWAASPNDYWVLDFKDFETLSDFIAVQDSILRKNHTTPVPKPDYLGAGRRIFVIMPFGPLWSKPVYAMIKSSVDDWPTTPKPVVLRADELQKPGKITEQIVDEIKNADVLVADITDLNGNVMWELGFAHAHGKQVIILNQDVKASPFDLKDYRQVSYNAKTPQRAAPEVFAYLRSVLGSD